MNYNEDYERALQYSQHEELRPTSDITGLTDALIADPTHEGKKMALADAMMEHGHPAYQHLGETLMNSEHEPLLCAFPHAYTSETHPVQRHSSNLPVVTHDPHFFRKNSLVQVAVQGSKSGRVIIASSLSHEQAAEHLTNLLGFHNADNALKTHKDFLRANEEQD